MVRDPDMGCLLRGVVFWRAPKNATLAAEAICQLSRPFYVNMDWRYRNNQRWFTVNARRPQERRVSPQYRVAATVMLAAVRKGWGIAAVADWATYEARLQGA
jgi:DNA-binding transcriptional LysR family regulator